jgi:predicted flap endonuclease-1-like 5' DNA nuclease
MFRRCKLFVSLLVLSPVLVAFTNSSQPAEQKNSVPWWFWALIFLLVLAAMLWWWWSSRQEKATPSAQVEMVAPAPAPVPDEIEQPKPDNLKRIEGIGPKISGLLQAAGIMTFAQLADTGVERLEQIVEDAGIGKIANPSTWPEQAALAAAGKWDELEVLQDELKGGRRV